MVLKSKDISLLTNICRVKVVVFPVVMYGSDSQTIKKDECWRIQSIQSLHHVQLLATPWTAASPTPGTSSNSCSRSWWIHATISSSVIPFSSHLRSFPASGSIYMSQLFASGVESIGVSASTSVLPMNIQHWFPLGWIGLISLQPKRLSRVFSNTTVQKHQFFGAQPSSQSNSHIHTWPLEKP